MMIAFDLDDTLYKEADYVESGRRHLAATFPAADIDGRWTAQMLASFRSHHPDIHLDDTTADTLRRLTDAGHRLALVTDGRSVTQRQKISALGLDRLIPARYILISAETGALKTRALPWRMLDALNDTSIARVYVGDNPEKDFMHPRRLGWATVMLRDFDGRNIHPQCVPAHQYTPVAPGIYKHAIDTDRTPLPHYIIDDMRLLTELLPNLDCINYKL